MLFLYMYLCVTTAKMYLRIVLKVIHSIFENIFIMKCGLLYFSGDENLCKFLLSPICDAHKMMLFCYPGNHFRGAFLCVHVRVTSVNRFMLYCFLCVCKIRKQICRVIYKGCIHCIDIFMSFYNIFTSIN